MHDFAFDAHPAHYPWAGLGRGLSGICGPPAHLYFNPRKKPYLLFLALETWVPHHSQKSCFIQNIVYSVGKI